MFANLRRKPKIPPFITNVEETLLLIRGVGQTPYGQLLLRYIRNKILVRADDALYGSGI